LIRIQSQEAKKELLFHSPHSTVLPEIISWNMIVMLSLIIPLGIDGDETTGMIIRDSAPSVYKERCVSHGIPLASSNGMTSIGSLHDTHTPFNPIRVE
jgi:hypothetical protein